MDEATLTKPTAPAKAKRKRAPAKKADTAMIPRPALAPAKSDTATGGPKKLPHLPKSGLVNNAAKDPPIGWAPGFHLSTCGNDSKQRTRYASEGWHLCKPGEGYVTDEGLCDGNDASGYLTYNGDVVMAMNAEDYDTYRALKASATKSAIRNQMKHDKGDIDSLARKHGDRESAHVPGNAHLTHEIGTLPDPENITI